MSEAEHDMNEKEMKEAELYGAIFSALNLVLEAGRNGLLSSEDIQRLRSLAN